MPINQVFRNWINACAVHGSTSRIICQRIGHNAADLGFVAPLIDEAATSMPTLNVHVLRRWRQSVEETKVETVAAAIAPAARAHSAANLKDRPEAVEAATV
tara:strand:- start:108 stop:410 length:303 start_codon:yes stop_codon:yes gene_type:complete